MVMVTGDKIKMIEKLSDSGRVFGLVLTNVGYGNGSVRVNKLSGMKAIFLVILFQTLICIIIVIMVEL